MIHWNVDGRCRGLCFRQLGCGPHRLLPAASQQHFSRFWFELFLWEMVCWESCTCPGLVWILPFGPLSPWQVLSLGPRSSPRLLWPLQRCPCWSLLAPEGLRWGQGPVPVGSASLGLAGHPAPYCLLLHPCHLLHPASPSLWVGSFAGLCPQGT